MTVTPRTASYDTALAQPATALKPSAARKVLADEARRDRRVFLGTMVVLAVMFGLLQNPYWVPAGDSEVYISIARSLVRGEGYLFNGQPVAMVPPGWPWVLALVMKITPYFLPLKLFTAACMLAALGVTYWVCRRFLSPGWAAFVVFSMGSLSHVYQATFWLISEALFCLITSTSLLVAMQIKERADRESGKEGWWRIALLVALCSFAVLVRWAGVLGALPIAAILLQGEPLRRIFGDIGNFLKASWAWLRTRGAAEWRYTPTTLSRLLLVCCIVGFTCLTTFLGLRASLSGWETSESAPLTSLTMAGGEESGASGSGAQLILADRLVGMRYNIISTSGMGGTTHSGRFIGWGRWFSWLYWQPFRAGMGDPIIDLGAQVFGWIIIGLLVFVAGYGAARREWMWLALLIYCAMLTLNWPNTNARYYVPIFFLLLIGMLRAGEALRAAFESRWWRGTVSVLLWMFLGSILLTNVALWAKDVQVARSDDFYSEYEAGLNNTIISANRYLSRLPDLRDAQVAVTPQYINMGKKRTSQFALRVTTMLTGKATINVPREKQYAPTNPKLAWFCQHYGIEYYLHQNPISPWRVWHYRVPEAWQARIQGSPVEKIEAGWALYRLVPYVPGVPGVLNEIPPRLELVETPPSRDWPTRVPGL